MLRTAVVRPRILAALLLLPLLLAVVPARSAHAEDNPVVVENQLPGSDAWQLGPLVADDRGGQIKGYASATSVSQNQSLTFFISVAPAQNYTIDIYRIGWYGGLGGRQVLHAGPLAGSPQQACLPDPGSGLIDCGWSPSYTFAVLPSWTSGVYLARLINAQLYENYIVFVVKDGRPAALLFQQSVTTYQAYNNYPDDGSSGKSLYEYNSYGPNTITGTPRAAKVSFDRPYSADGESLFLTWEIDFVRWQERMGYDVTYITDVDTHTSGQLLRQSRGFLSVGHDEYWSFEMFDAAEAARDSGVGLAFFGANAVYWQVRFEPSSVGSQNRVMVCYKSASIDPGQGRRTTVTFRDPIVARPEQLLLGVQFTSMVNWGSNVDYVVANSAHWAYSGTGFQDGDRIPNLVGYEMDRYMSGYPLPSVVRRDLLSVSPYTDVDGNPDYANSSMYQSSPSGAWVFAAGTISWSWGLDDYSGSPDARIQRTTANILNTFVSGLPPAGGEASVWSPPERSSSPPGSAPRRSPLPSTTTVP